MSYRTVGTASSWRTDIKVLADAAGKMSKFKIRVLAGDRVTLMLSPYDLTRGRITFRHK